jgi:hypothetical protein
MERFWRTLREGLLDFMPRNLSLQEVQQRLDTWLARHYHTQPHASLMGDSPGIAWEARQTRLTTEEELSAALTVRARRRVTRDGVVTVEGRRYEVRQGFLAGRLVDVTSCLVDGLTPTVQVEYDGRTYALSPLDEKANAHARRALRPATATPTVPFDPGAPLPTPAAAQEVVP